MTYLKFEHTEVSNIVGALRGIRNPLNSWDKSDSITTGHLFQIGKNDMDLCKRLIKGGSEHRKFLQQIFVCVDITAPRYWWQEADTYRVGITKNSCSTMHKIHERLLTKDDFEHISDSALMEINSFVYSYQDTKSAENLMRLKSMLPEGFLQKRTVTMNYENLLNIYKQRKNHRLPHWSKDFMRWIKCLPYMNEFLSALEENTEVKNG